jgi:hypothetical protein
MVNNAPLAASESIPNHTLEYGRTPTLRRLAILYARMALGAAFLSGIADRFGLYGGRNVGYGDFRGFMRYTAEVNSFMRRPLFYFLLGPQLRLNSPWESR